jgi:hypothetical protein
MGKLVVARAAIWTSYWRIQEEGVQAFCEDGAECRCVIHGNTCTRGDQCPNTFLALLQTFVN